MAKLLFDHGADFSAQGRHYDTRQGRFTDRNAVQIASEKGHHAVEKLLLEHGANLNISVKMGAAHLQRLQPWQERDYRIAHVNNYNGVHHEVTTAIDMALKGGHEDIVSLMLKSGATAVSTHNTGCMLMH